MRIKTNQNYSSKQRHVLYIWHASHLFLLVCMKVFICTANRGLNTDLTQQQPQDWMHHLFVIRSSGLFMQAVWDFFSIIKLKKIIPLCIKQLIVPTSGVPQVLATKCMLDHNISQKQCAVLLEIYQNSNCTFTEKLFSEYHQVKLEIKPVSQMFAQSTSYRPWLAT